MSLRTIGPCNEARMEVDHRLVPLSQLIAETTVTTTLLDS